MKRVIILLTLCVFLSSCVRPSPLGRHSNPVHVPGNVYPESFLFGLRDTCDWTGAEARVRLGEKVIPVVVILRDSQFDRIVRFPKLYGFDGKKLKLDSTKLLKQVMAMPAIDLNKLSDFSPKELEGGQDFWNIAPAFLLLGPFLITDLMDLHKDQAIPLGTPAWKLPRGGWVEVSDALVNRSRSTAVKVRNGLVYQVVHGPFFSCEYGAF